MTDTNKLMPALLSAQKEIDNVKKDTKNGAFAGGNVRYAQLDTVWEGCKEALNKHGIVVLQLPGKDELGHHVETKLVHAESGESISSKFYCQPEKTTPHAVGSATTYARRYGLQSMVMICPEDDDGNAASQAEKRQEQREARDLQNERQQRMVNVTRGKRVQDVEPSPFSQVDPNDDI